MKEIFEKILNNFKSVDIPLDPLPPKLLFTGALKRPGISAEEMASEIISKQSEAGAPFGEVFNGVNNIAEEMEVIRCQVMIDQLLTKAKIEIIIPPGVPVRTVGASPSGTVVSEGVTTGIASGYGVIR